jgi:sorbitol/mannitol transport system permease protein
MATLHTRSVARIMVAPSVALLFLWMAVPLAMTLYFSFIRYNLLIPGPRSFIGFDNYYFFLTDPAFATALGNTLIIVGGVLLITIVGGILLALLLDQPVFGQGIVRLLVISPFFVLPTVAALVWKNMMMNPVYGCSRSSPAVWEWRRSIGSRRSPSYRSRSSSLGSGCPLRH